MNAHKSNYLVFGILPCILWAGCAQPDFQQMPDLYKSAAADSTLSQLDADVDGAISRIEYLGFCSGQGISPLVANRDFDRLDADKNGSVSRTEIQKGLSIRPSGS
jgi:hypothetical protein